MLQVSMPPGFEAHSVLGQGAMGRVYKAWQPKLQRYVAIKTCNLREASEADQDPGRLEDEALTIARLNHPNIISLYDVARDDENIYLIMELIEGAPLSSLVNREVPVESLGPVRECLVPGRRVCRTEWLCQIGAAVARALQYAHERSVLHRDVKPANIIITNGLHVKLLDFSIARNTGKKDGRTATGLVFGTVAYMSPEQILSKPLDGRTDIYSLGATLYHLATGSVVFPDENEISMCMKHVNNAPGNPRESNDEVSPALAEIILRCLEKDPADRYESARELGQALTVALHAPEGLDESSESESAAAEAIREYEELKADESAPDIRFDDSIFFLGASPQDPERRRTASRAPGDQSLVDLPEEYRKRGLQEKFQNTGGVGPAAYGRPGGGNGGAGGPGAAPGGSAVPGGSGVLSGPSPQAWDSESSGRRAKRRRGLEDIVAEASAEGDAAREGTAPPAAPSPIRSFSEELQASAPPRARHGDAGDHDMMAGPIADDDAEGTTHTVLFDRPRGWRLLFGLVLLAAAAATLIVLALVLTGDPERPERRAAPGAAPGIEPAPVETILADRRRAVIRWGELAERPAPGDVLRVFLPTGIEMAFVWVDAPHGGPGPFLVADAPVTRRQFSVVTGIALDGDPDAMLDRVDWAGITGFVSELNRIAEDGTFDLPALDDFAAMGDDPALAAYLPAGPEVTRTLADGTGDASARPGTGTEPPGALLLADPGTDGDPATRTWNTARARDGAGFRLVLRRPAPSSRANTP